MKKVHVALYRDKIFTLQLCIVQDNFIKLWSEEIIALNSKFLSFLVLKIYVSSCGMLVVNPDHLVSGTSVVSALFCLRKAVLAEKFKGGGGGGSKVRNQCC
jgi:hypothetical protein